MFSQMLSVFFLLSVFSAFRFCPFLFITRSRSQGGPWEQNPAGLFVKDRHGDLLCVGRLLSSVGGHAMGLNTFHIPDGGRLMHLRVAPLPTFALVDTHPSEGKEEKPFSFPCEDGDIFIPINPRPDSDVLRLELRARVTNPAWKEDHIVFLSIHLCFCPRLDKCLEPSKGPAVPLEVFFCPFRSTEKKKE